MTLADFASGYQCFMGRWSERLAGPVVDFCGVGEREVVLDVGCGLGNLAHAVLTRTGTTVVTGIDRRHEAVAAARCGRAVGARPPSRPLRMALGRLQRQPGVSAAYVAEEQCVVG